MDIPKSILLLGIVTIICLLYHVYYFHWSDKKYSECERACDDGKDQPCRNSTTDTLMDCNAYYKCIDKCKS